MNLKQLEITLLMKLGSIAVHADEMIAPGGHHFDKHALEGLMADPEVRAFLATLDAGCMLPLRRDGVRYKESAR